MGEDGIIVRIMGDGIREEDIGAAGIRVVGEVGRV
jgi:hypothetical protein